MRILVTGSSGFVGTRLAQRLHEDGHSLVSLGRETPDDESKLFSESFIADFSDGDFSPPDLSKIDVVVHLAGHAHAASSRKNAELHHLINFVATKKLVAAAARDGVKHFLFLSSIAVYGEPSVRHAVKWSESSPVKPATPYGKAKLEAERAILAAAQGASMTTTILRPSLIYGPGAPGNFSLLQKFVRTGLPLPIGGFRNRRSFLYLENLLDLVSVILKSSQTEKSAIFNVADQDVVSTSEFVSAIAQALDRRSPVVDFPEPLAMALMTALGQRQRFAKLVANCEIDIRLVQQKLSWAPRHSTVVGVASSLA